MQENAPERLDLKRQLWAELDRLAPAGAVLASSTSALLPSRFTEHLAGRHRCLGARLGRVERSDEGRFLGLGNVTLRHASGGRHPVTHCVRLSRGLRAGMPAFADMPWAGWQLLRR